MIPQGRWRRPAALAVVVLAVAAVAVLANLALLDSTGEERLGRLGQSDPALASPATTTAARTAIGPLRGAGMVDLHRHLSLLALGAIAIHGGSLLFDRTVDIEPIALVVPGLIPYRPVWTGIGVLAAELALLIHLSFRFRSRIGVKAWRRLHFATYAVFAGGAVHGIAAGTDTGSTSARMLYAASVGAVAALTGLRAVTAPTEAA